MRKLKMGTKLNQDPIIIHEWNGHLAIFFSRPLVMENSIQYLPLQTDILQETVVGCPSNAKEGVRFLTRHLIISIWRGRVETGSASRLPSSRLPIFPACITQALP